jgi:hypothetical protein
MTTNHFIVSRKSALRKKKNLERGNYKKEKLKTEG